MLVGKFADMFYSIEKEHVTLEVVELKENCPDVHISKGFSTIHSGFWKFVLDVVIGTKQQCNEIVENKDGISTLAAINTAKTYIEELQEVETALSGLIANAQK